MLKALTSLLIAGAVALAVASPAAAAPVCNDDTVVAIAFSPFAAWGGDTSEFCDDSYSIVSVDWSVGWYYASFNGSSFYLDGVYYSQEWATITVTDGVDTDTFTLTVTPCYDQTWPYGDSC